MKKKLLSVLLTVAMAATLLAGCGSNNAAPADTGAEQESAEQESAEADAEAAVGQSAEALPQGGKVTALFLSLEGEYFTFLDSLLEEGLTELGYEYESQSSNGDDVTMIEQIENAVAGGTDLIWTWPVNGNAIADALKSAMDQGVLVYSFIQNPGEDSCTVFRGSNSEQCGQTIGKMTKDWADKEYGECEAGTIKTVIMGSTANQATNDMLTALKATLEADARFDIMEVVDTEASIVKAQEAAENMFSKYEKIDCISTTGGEFATGVAAYLTSEACVVSDPTAIGLFGTEINTEIADYISKGIIKGNAVNGGNIVNNIQTQVEQMDALLKGETLDHYSWVDIGEVTIDNMAEYGY